MTVPIGLELFVREDIRDTVRERQFQLLVGIYVLLALLMTSAAGRASATDPELVSPLVTLFAMVTPLLALGFFASAIVEKRTSGALTVVLGLPIDRSTVVVGTFLGRSIVICTAVVTAVLAAVPVALGFDIAIDPVRLVGVASLLALLGVTFTAIAVAISAIVRSATRATATAFGAFVLFFFDLWAHLPRTVLYVTHGFSIPETTPEWVTFVSALNPVAAYTNLFSGLFPGFNSGTFISPPSEAAIYQEPSFAFVILVGWIVFAIGLGVWRFQTTDI